jgi:hypothetical protein
MTVGMDVRMSERDDGAATGRVKCDEIKKGIIKKVEDFLPCLFWNL